MSNKNNNKYKFTVRMEPETEKEMRKYLKESHEKSLNDFVVKAIEFYIGYLRQGKNLDFVSPILSSAIKAETHTMERKLSEMMFKIAVQLSMVNQLMIDEKEFYPEYLDELEKWCAEKVASVNGIIALEDTDKRGNTYNPYSIRE